MMIEKDADVCVVLSKCRSSELGTNCDRMQCTERTRDHTPDPLTSLPSSLRGLHRYGARSALSLPGKVVHASGDITLTCN